MKKIFSVAPPRLGGIDMLIPIYIEMKQRGDVSIELIIDNNLVLSQLKRDNFLYKKLFSVVDKISFIEKKRISNGSNIITDAYNYCIVLSQILCIALRIFSSKAPILMHSGNLSSRLINILNRLVKIKKGFTVAHYNLMVMFSNADNSESRKSRECFGDFFLCFSEAYTRDSFETGKYINIGYPRLYKSWINIVREEAKYFVDTEIRSLVTCHNEPLLTLFLPSTVKGQFEESELEGWLIEVSSCLLNIFPNCLIVIKPHPMQNLDHLKDFLDTQISFRYVISFLHPALLASESRVVISHHSSTIFDALALQAPVIQHQEFTNHWLKHHPEGSKFLELGHSWTNNKESLARELIKIKDNNWSHPKFVSSIGHANRIEQFFEKIRL